MSLQNLILSCFLIVVGAIPSVADEPLADDWDAKRAGDAVMERLVRVTGPEVRGAHDAEFALVGDRGFVVAEVSDERAGESPAWPEVHVTLSVVDLNTLQVERIIPLARGEQVFENTTLPVGACFVPRILQKDEQTLRCYFASERPGQRQSTMWYRDFDIASLTFARTIHKVKLRTDAGTFDMQPRYLYEDTVGHGFSRRAVDYGVYLFDSFKQFEGRTYVALNNFPGKQNALSVMHDDYATFEVLGHYNAPESARTSESSVNRLPDGTWMAICRNDGGNYLFMTSSDGRDWTEGREMSFVMNGANSKPTFDRFNGQYYLGWQEKTRIDDVYRSVFNLDVSRDGKTWQRKYRFETTRSFQYPTFHEHKGSIWLTVTQGDSDSTRKERIMFGKLEELAGQE